MLLETTFIISNNSVVFLLLLLQTLEREGCDEDANYEEWAEAQDDLSCFSNWYLVAAIFVHQKSSFLRHLDGNSCSADEAAECADVAE